MEATLGVVHSELETAYWRLFREFFDKAEKKRRWRIADDIPWERCNPNLNPAVANVVESARRPAEPGADVVLRQLGVRGIQALDCARGLVAAIRRAFGRADDRPR